MITLASIMRNSGEYLSRYLAQVGELQELYPDLRVVIGEGDHTDNSGQQLHLFAPHYCEIVNVSHGGERFGSVDHPRRWDQIATCVRTVLDKVGDPGDALVWVEADLIWDVPDIAHLIQSLNHVPAVAPRVMAQDTDRWYDTWGYRQHGTKFNAWAPYWHQPEERYADFIKIESCGSCFAASPAVSEWLSDWTGHWPATLGGDLWLDPRVTIRHP